MGKKEAQQTVRRLQKAFPEVMEALEALDGAARDAGPLDEKAVVLLRFAAALAVGADEAMRGYAGQAMDAGVRADELRHAVIALANVVSAPRVIAASFVVDEALAAKKVKK